MIRIILFFICNTFIFASQVSFEQIDKSQNTIQIAVAKNIQEFDKLKTLVQKYDTYVEKRVMYVYYVVNIKPSETQKVLETLREHITDAFVISTSIINEPEQNVAIPIDNTIYEKQLYKDALALYTTQQYEESYQKFNELFFQNLDNVMINFYLGRSAYETGRYEFAISAYDRILIKEPDNVRVRLELAQTYLKMQLYSQALSEFNTALQGKMPLKVQQKVLSNIELIKQRQTKHFFNVTAMFGLTYDSNINTSADAGDYTIYSPTLNSNLTMNNSGEQKSAMIAQTVGVLSYKYKPNENFAINNSLTAMLLKYKGHKSNDILYLSFNTAPTWYAKSFKTAIDFTFDKIDYGHESYQSNFYVTPSFTKVLTPSILYTVGLKMGQISNKLNSDKDANVIEWQNSFKYLTEDYGMFTFKVNLGKEIEQKETRTDVSYSYYHFGVSNSFDFFDIYSLQSAYAYSLENYKDMDVNFLTKREDEKHEFSLGVQRKIDDTSVVNFGGNYINRPSNHAIYEYDKYTLKVSYIKSF